MQQKVSLILLFLLLCLPVQAKSYEAVMAESARVFRGPGPTYPMIDWITADSEIVIHARNKIGNWLQISWKDGSHDGEHGWVMMGFVNLPENFRLSQIDVDESLPDADLKRVGDGALDKALYSVPLVPDIEPEMCEVYERGIEKGNQPGVISKVGDSNSVSQHYLAPMSRDEYDLGPYDFLAGTVELYKDSFGITSAAARVGMNTAAVFDPLWSNSDDCKSGESPLSCEYRLTKPTVAIIMFGSNDLNVLRAEEYEIQMREIVETTLAADIIPVLVMFTMNPEHENYPQTLIFNQIIAQIAADHDIPVINFWMAAKELPSAGVGEDNIHLTQFGSGFMLGRNETYNGLPLHNLLVLHVLKSITETCG